MINKKKALVIFGSPHKNGFTASMCNYFISNLKKYDVNIVNAFESNFRPCIDCKKCSFSKSCVFSDMDNFDLLFRRSNLIILASPLYNFSFPAPLKSIIDRFQRYYNEKYLLDRLGDAVKAVQLDKAMRQRILDAVIELNKQEQDFQSESLKRLNTEAEKLRHEIRAIYQDKLDGILTVAQWQEENELRQQRLIAIKARIEAFDLTNQKFMDEINLTLELLENTYDKYLEVSDEAKAELLKTLLSNCTLKDGNLSWTYKKPFCYIAEKADFEKIYPSEVDRRIKY